MNREKFRKIIEKHFNDSVVSLIMLAYRLSKGGHINQKRDGGEWYFNHPRRVALILIKELGVYNRDLIIAALLHDIEEDCDILENGDTKHIFGVKAARTVASLTRRRKESKVAYLKRISRADKSEKLIKLADRLDNMRDLKGWESEKILRYARETEKYILPWADKVSLRIAKELREICSEYKENKNGEWNVRYQTYCEWVSPGAKNYHWRSASLNIKSYKMKALAKEKAIEILLKADSYHSQIMDAEIIWEDSGRMKKTTENIHSDFISARHEKYHRR